MESGWFGTVFDGVLLVDAAGVAGGVCSAAVERG